MALKPCIKATANLAEEDVDAVLEGFDSYQGSMDQDAAAALAVDDAIASAEQERAGFLELIYETHPDLVPAEPAIEPFIPIPDDPAYKTVLEDGVVKVRIDRSLINRDADNFGYPTDTTPLADDHPLVAQDTKAKYTIPGSQHPELAPGEPDYDPGRKVLHEEWIEAALADGMTPQEIEEEEGGLGPTPKPLAVLTGGGGAAGKGTLLKILQARGDLPTHGFVHVDPDKIKEKIPEFGLIQRLLDSRAAPIAHEESSAVSKVITNRAIAAGMNIIIDKTLSDPAKTMKQIQELRDAGYEVRLVGATLDIDEALIRALGRYYGSGRLPLVSHMVMAHINFNKSYESYAKAVDEAIIFDNTGKPQEVMTAQGGSISILNENLYNRTRNRGKVDGKSKTLRQVETPKRDQADHAKGNDQGNKGKNDSRSQGTARQDEASRLPPPVDPPAPPGDFTSRSEPITSVPKKSIGYDSLNRLVREMQIDAPGTRGISFSVYKTQDEALGPGSIERMGGKVQGGFYAGTDEIILISDHIANIEELHTVLRHEMVGHYGLRKVLGNKKGYDRLLGRVYAARNAELKDAHDWVTRNYPGLVAANDTATIADEMLARISETQGENPSGFLTRIFDEIIRLFNLIGLGGKSITHAEVRSLIRTSERRLRQRKIPGQSLRDIGEIEYEMYLETVGEGKPMAFNEWSSQMGIAARVAEENAQAEAKGLDMSKDARLKRARDMGFDTKTTFYHGTKNQFNSFNPDWEERGAIFVTPSQELAEEFSRYGNPRGANVKELRIRPGKMFDKETATKAEIKTLRAELEKQLRNEFSPAGAKEMADNWSFDADHKFIEHWAVMSAIKEAGYDSFAVREEESDVKNIGLFNPSDLRSVDAAFDPAFKDSGNLLARREDQTETPEFKAWFGDSKVVDDAGKPLVVYRGEHGGIASMKGRHTRLGAISYGSLSAAQTYSIEPNNRKDSAVDPQVTAAYLKIEKPVLVNKGDPFIDMIDIMEAVGVENAEIIAKDPDVQDAIANTSNFEEVAEALGLDPSVASVDEVLDAGKLQELYLDAYVVFNKKEFVDMFKAAGYDGAIHGGNGETAMETEYKIFDATQAKSADENTGAFDPGNPDIRFRRATDEAADEPTEGNLGLPEETWRQKFVRLAQNSFNRVGQLQKELEAQGGKVRFEGDVYGTEERSSSKITYRLRQLDQDHMKPLLEHMRENDISIDELDEFLVAKHARERNAWIASINDDMPDGGSGMTNAEADSVLVRAGDRLPSLERAALYVYAVNDQNLNDLVDGGHLDQATVDDWKSRWSFYVPLKGKAGEEGRPGTGVGYSIGGKVTQKAMGRGAGNLAESPTAHSFGQAEATIVRTEKTKVGQALLQLVRDNPDPNFWTISQRQYSRMVDAFGEVFEGYETVPEGLIENLDYTRVTNSKGKVVFKLNPNYKNRDDVFTVMSEGQEFLIQIKDTILMNQLKKMSTTQLGAVTRFFGTVNRYLAMINTALNPEFVITNFERDFQTAMVNLGGEHSAAIAAKVMKAIPGATRGIWQSTFGTKGQSEWREIFDEMQKEGGTIGFFGLEDIDSKVKNIQNRLINQQGVLGRTKRGVLLVRDAVLDANLSVENAARLAAYKVIRDEAIGNGLSPKEARARAASVAKNLTVNFNRKGELAPVLNSAYLFYNASIQGSARILTALKHPRVRKIAGGIMATSFALAMYNRSAGGDDDDEIPHWDKISDYLKQTNIIIMHPDGSGNYTKIKLPYGYNVFAYSGTAMHDLMFDPRKTAAEQSMNMLSAFLNAFNPIQGADFLDTITPTFLKPYEQDVRNINFMGTPLKPENPFDQYDRPESDKAFKSTNPMLKEMMAALNEWTGGDITHSGLIDISPEIVEHYVSWLTGGAGMTATRAVGTAINLFEGEELEARNIPFARTITGSPGSHFDTERFYDAVKEVAAVEAQLKILKGTDDWQGYRDENSEVHKLAIHVRKYKNRIKKLREQRDKAYADDNKDLANEKREEIRQQMMEFSIRFDEARAAQE